MIAKIAIFIILGIVLCNIYFSWTFLHNAKKRSKWGYAVLTCIGIASAWMIYSTIEQAREPDYFPDDFAGLFRYIDHLVYLGALLVFVTLGGLIGLFFKKQQAGHAIGLVLAILCCLLYNYCKDTGFKQLEVRRIELSFDDLPKAFNGYRIVLFSDAHVGTMTDGREELLKRAVDSINAQNADLIVFAGDLVNKRPQELKPHLSLLSTLKARDGVYSVLGNHDYSVYLANNDPAVEYEHLEHLGFLQQKMNWHLLRNYHTLLRRGNDSIVLAGMENDGEGRFPQKGDIKNTLWGVNRDQFVIMLQHDPTSWRRKILKECHAQLTLSGHTHGGQVSILGFSPAAFNYDEYDGLYTAPPHPNTPVPPLPRTSAPPHPRYLFVSKGLGGLVPFRLGAPGEIVVITLRKG